MNEAPAASGTHRARFTGLLASARSFTAGFVAVSCAMCPVSAACAQTKPLIGLAINLPEGGKMRDLGRIVNENYRDGVRLMCISAKWSEIEPKPGEYDLHTLDGNAILRSLGYTLALTIQTLDTNNRTLPADLADKPFDSPELRARFDALLRAIAAKLNPAVNWVMLGNEVDVYLGLHPKELEPYAGFIEHSRDTLRALRRGQAVGVTITHDGSRDRPAMVSRLNQAMDVVSMTYYPLGSDFKVRPVSELPTDFARMVKTAGSKPLLIQEFGCPADPLISSEDLQAAYLDGLFDQLAKYKDRVAGAAWFIQYDFSSSMVEGFLKYYRVPDPRFRVYLATLGLRRANGAPRKAWDHFRTRARAWSAP